MVCGIACILVNAEKAKPAELEPHMSVDHVISAL